jgi:uncharacterized protein (DUF488 family)
MDIKLYTIGFTKKNAEKFFSLLRKNNVKLLIDIRLNNVSQLAGFAKRDDLKFFLREICSCSYIHLPDFAPTKDILDKYKNHNISWLQYKELFTKLIAARKIEYVLSDEQIDNSCLLCSESTHENCHRSIVAEYLKDKNKNIKITHL